MSRCDLAHPFIAASTLASTICTPLRRPPCTALKPIASTSPASFRQPIAGSVNCSSVRRTAAAWSGTAAVISSRRPWRFRRSNGFRRNDPPRCRRAPTGVRRSCRRAGTLKAGRTEVGNEDFHGFSARILSAICRGLSREPAGRTPACRAPLPRRTPLGQDKPRSAVGRTRNHVARNELPNLRGRRGAGFDRRPHAAHVAAHDGRDIGAADGDAF